VTLDHTNLNR